MRPKTAPSDKLSGLREEPDSYPFEKCHGARNDFLFLRQGTHLQGDPDWSLRARRLCERREGFGADGLILWDAESIDGVSRLVSMDIWNSDGSRAATCGNALRCLGLILMRHGLWTGETPLEVHSVTPISSGSQTTNPFARLESAQWTKEGSEWEAQVCVNMGQRRRIEGLSDEAHRVFAQCLPPTWTLRDLVYVELANPHVVLVLGAPAASPKQSMTLLEELARAQAPRLKTLLQQEGFNPKDLGDSEVNLGFCWPQDTQNQAASLVVHERGAGLTEACGSGAVAAAHALERLLRTSPSAPSSPRSPQWQLTLPGGTLTIALKGLEADMTGPAVFTGICRIPRDGPENRP